MVALWIQANDNKYENHISQKALAGTRCEKNQSTLTIYLLSLLGTEYFSFFTEIFKEYIQYMARYVNFYLVKLL